MEPTTAERPPSSDSSAVPSSASERRAKAHGAVQVRDEAAVFNLDRAPCHGRAAPVDGVAVLGGGTGEPEAVDTDGLGGGERQVARLAVVIRRRGVDGIAVEVAAKVDGTLTRPSLPMTRSGLSSPSRTGVFPRRNSPSYKTTHFCCAFCRGARTTSVTAARTRRMPSP